MSEDDIERKPLVNLRVNEQQKKKWENHAEESDMYSNLSDLIRKSVEKEIKSEGSDSSIISEQMQSTISPKLEELEQDLEQLKTDVAWLRSQQEHDIEEFAHDLFSNLESVPTDDPDELSAKIGLTAGLRPQTVDDLAERMNSTPRRVNEAIDFLRNQHMPLIRFEVDGETHWFKEE